MMKNRRYGVWAVITAAVTLLTSCAAHKPAYLYTSFHEPATAGLRMLYSYDARNWTDLDTVLLRPEVGEQQVMRDPSMGQGPDGVFHLVWTSSWRGDKGFGYASSRDLIHWSKQQLIPVMAQEPETVNVWAPELFYDADSARYIMVWASTIPGRFARGVEDEKNNHRLYYTTTTDFVTFTPARLFLDPGFSVIDAVIVKQEAGKYVLILKDNTRPERDIKVAFSDKVLGPYTHVSAPFTAALTEGPSVVKAGKEWLIYYDAYGKKNFGAAATSDFVHFEDASARVHVPEGHKHGTICVVSRKTVKQLIKDLHKR